MKNNLLSFKLSCICFAVILTGCHTAKKAVVPPANKPAPTRSDNTYKPVSGRYSKPPKFIDNVYMDHHNKTTATANAIQPKRVLEKTRSASRIANADLQPLIVSTEPKETYRTRDIRSLTSVPAPEESYPKGKHNALFVKYADMMEVKARELDNFPLYRFIDKWYGTDYKMGGCDISGIDCSGFAQRLYSDVYGTDLLRTSMEQFKNCERIKHSADAHEGDLIFFKANGRRISHVGVYLANDYFVHASTSNGVIISNLNEEYWRKTYAGIGRIPKG